MNTRYTRVASSEAYSVDAGLRQYMVAVYRYMGSALLLTAFVAYFASQSQSLVGLGLPASIVAFFLVMWMGSGNRIQSMSVSSAQLAFWAYAGLMGIALSYIFIVYTSVSVTRAFFITASLFGAMSIYGQVTKRDLTSIGSFMFMGLIGIVLASIVNIFMHSSMIDFVTSVLGVVIFTGLTAYDTHKIKDNYYYMNGSPGEMAAKLAIFGALTLYLDFINLFISLLRLMGNRRD